jgi:branched-chain amino acid transport system permease protein
MVALASVVLVILLGAVFQQFVMRRLLEADHLSQVFATIALLFIGQGAVRYFVVVPERLPSLLPGPPLAIGPAVVQRQYLAALVVLLLVVVGTTVLFRFTDAGRILRATTQSIRGAALVGINTNRVFGTTWALSAGLGALAGILAAPIFLVSADMGARTLIFAFAGMTLGGFGSIPGAVVGSLLTGLAVVLSATYFSTTLGDAAGFSLILLVLMIRPQGLFSTKGWVA